MNFRAIIVQQISLHYNSIMRDKVYATVKIYKAESTLEND